MKKIINLTNSNIKYYIQTFAKSMQDLNVVMDFTLLYNIRKNMQKSMQDLNVVMDFTLLYNIRKNMQKLEDAIKPYDATVYDIREKYNINSGDASEEDKANAEREFINLGQIEVPVEIDTIPISMFSGINCTISFMNSIFFMIDG